MNTQIKSYYLRQAITWMSRARNYPPHSLTCNARLGITLLVMLMSVTVWAQTYTVTLKAGTGTGDDVVISNADPENVAESFHSAGRGQFYQEGDGWGFRFPDCPGSFTAPTDQVFYGWDAGSPGGFRLLSSDLTLTAQWGPVGGDSKLKSFVPSVGTLHPEFNPDEFNYAIYVPYTDSEVEVEVTVAVEARDPNATIKYGEDASSDECYPSSPGQDDYVVVRNGASETRYFYWVRFLYSIIMVTEGKGTTKWMVYGYDRNTGEEGNWGYLKATPAEGWQFKEWQKISGNGTLEDATSQNYACYTIGTDNSVLKAVFEPAPFDLTAHEATVNSKTKFWTTYYNNAVAYRIDEEENACAYTATVDGDNITLQTLGKEIPKGTAVIIVGEDGSVSMTPDNTIDDFTGTNDLRGEDDRTAREDILTGALDGGMLYVMGKVSDDFGFFEYTGAYMPANKAYIALPATASAPARGFGFVEKDDETTGIEEMEDGRWKTEDAWYTLSGVKLEEKPTERGMYIHQGRKEAVR